MRKINLLRARNLKYIATISIVFILVIPLINSDKFLFNNQNNSEKKDFINNNTKTESSFDQYIDNDNSQIPLESKITNNNTKLMSTSLPEEQESNKLEKNTLYKTNSLGKLSSTAFVSRWDTTKTSSGSSTSNQIKLPLESIGYYNFSVNWGDGAIDRITSYNQPEVTHTYASSGIYTVSIDGPLTGWRFNSGGDKLKIIEIPQWGSINLGNSGSYFYGSANLVITATDAPDLRSTTSLYQAFADCINLGASGSMNDWDVSKVTDMEMMFAFANRFNQPLDNWNVSSVTNMNAMFYGAIDFNQSINSWDVSKVTDMGLMFDSAWDFNQPLGDWDVSSVTNMYGMFWADSYFNQPLINWNVAKVTDMYGMFSGASSFNQPLDTWNVSSVQTMGSMFSGASSFNQPLNTWDVSNVQIMGSMFTGASSFNQPLGSWDVSNVTYMYGMFSSASSFNQPLDTWNVSSVTNMDQMFNGIELSIKNYDNLLLGWAKLPLQQNVVFSGGNSKYNHLASNARSYIITTFVWTITDGGFTTQTFPFISRWDTTKTSTGSSPSNQIRLPLVSTGIYNFQVDWGDGIINTITSYNQLEVTHIYVTSGIHTVSIEGTIIGWQFNNGGDRLKIIEISKWGWLNLGNLGSYFYGCDNLVLTATDAPDLTGTTNLYRAFYGCTNLGASGSMNNWDVSNVNRMDYMFAYASSFNQPIGSWDVSSVTTLMSMFQNASSFNQPIGSWDVSSVIYMRLMFMYASSFNQPLGTWNVSFTSYMESMFAYATSFNQPLDTWDVLNVRNFNNMFDHASSFNSPLNNWNLSYFRPRNINYMFAYASSFNQPLDTWDISGVHSFIGLFDHATSFNQPFTWDMSGITIMDYMFAYASSFNQSIASWNVSNIISMVGMFENVSLPTSNYDQLLNNWSKLPLQQSVTFDGGLSQFSPLATLAKTILLNTFRWVITDGGMTPPPTISSPNDLSLYEGNTSSILWTANDMYPANYIVYLNNSVFQTGEWSSKIIYVSLDYLNSGLYNFTCAVFNIYGQKTIDQVWVTVLPVVDNKAPIITFPSDIVFDVGSIGYSIVWIGFDDHPWWKSVWRNNTLIYDQSWSSYNNKIEINLDRLDIGVYNFTCTFYDESGNYGTDMVWVSVLDPGSDTLSPNILPVDPITYEEGSTGNYLTWNCSDDHPYSYKITVNDTALTGYELHPWHGENVTIPIDGLAVGTWNFTLTVWDLAGNLDSKSVTVIVVPQAPDTTRPVANRPADIIVAEGMAGTIVWEVSDDHPSTYAIYKNGSLIFEQDYWDSGIIQYHFSSLPLGTWEINLTLWDKAGNSFSTKVFVKVLSGSQYDTQPPQISHINDQSFIYRSSNHTVIIYLFDNHPERYVIIISPNNDYRIEHSWSIPNSQVEISLDKLEIGIYTVNISAWDSFGNFASQSFTVTVSGDNSPPTINHPSDVIGHSGTTIELTWQISDNDISYYELFDLDTNEMISTGNISTNELTVSISNLILGTHNLRVFVYDTSGNCAYDDLVVTIIESESSSKGSGSAPGFEFLTFLAFMVILILFNKFCIKFRRVEK